MAQYPRKCRDEPTLESRFFPQILRDSLGFEKIIRYAHEKDNHKKEGNQAYQNAATDFKGTQNIVGAQDKQNNVEDNDKTQENDSIPRSFPGFSFVSAFQPINPNVITAPIATAMDSTKLKTFLKTANLFPRMAASAGN